MNVGEFHLRLGRLSKSNWGADMFGENTDTLATDSGDDCGDI